MGSIVGGLFCAGVPLDEIQQMLFDKSLMHAFMGHLPPKIAIAPIGKLTHPFGTKHYAGLWTGDKFEKYLKAHLPEPDMQVGDTKIPFSSVATNLIDGKAYRISDGPLSRAMRASASLSPIIQPIQIGDKVFVDGGVRANLPCSSAKETGADVVIGVLVDEPLKPMDAQKFKHLSGIASRLTDIVLAVSDERQLEFADVVVNPDVSGVEVLSKNSADITRAAAAGELAGEKAIPAILKKIAEAQAKARSRVAVAPNKGAE
jgi:NTE family protein